MSITRSFPITLDFGNTNTMETNIKFKQYDYGTNFVDVQIEFNSETMDLTDCEVVAVFRGEKGNIIVDKTVPTRQMLRTLCQIYSATQGRILLPINKQLLAENGKVFAELVIFNSDGTSRITSPTFNFNVVSSLAILDSNTPQALREG